ncbi:MAG: cytochrome C oxidase subunit IV family protein [Segniliparus sp.]|uniref:cytochrome C oxidase subunit IV family protein n=1 Tax=Segniliparus sp. TaxID=2804064 RepID=UPI003F3A50D1
MTIETTMESSGPQARADEPSDSPAAESRGALIAVWAVLVAATVASLVMGLERSHHSQILPVAILLVCFGKILLIGHYFMELRAAHRVLRLLFIGYVAATCVALLGFYA